jgi:2-polyprenyl-3-methyl-5-hydroxy-6-metoxy-1,4-benzoquinol methylase
VAVPQPVAASAPKQTDADLFQRALSETRYQHIPGGRKKLETLFGLAAELRPDRILDVGCGNGGLALPLALVGCEVVATDVDRRSIDYCRSSCRFPNVTFVPTDGALGEITGIFDLIVCSEVLEHLEAPDALIAAMAAKLSPRGRLFITIPNGYGAREVGGRAERYLRERLRLERLFVALRRLLGRHGMVAESEKYLTYTSNPDQDHVQKFTTTDIRRRLARQRLALLEWRSSFVLFSIFQTRAGSSAIERFDSWAADHLPAAMASGWYLVCA